MQHQKHAKTKETLEDLKRQYSAPSLQKFNSLAANSSSMNPSNLLKVTTSDTYKKKNKNKKVENKQHEKPAKLLREDAQIIVVQDTIQTRDPDYRK